MLSCATTRHARQEKEALSPALRATYLYTEGIKASLLDPDPAYAATIFRRVLALDSTHAPSYYELASLYAPEAPAKAIPYSLNACRLDTANVWYQAQLGRLYIVTQQYNKAFEIYSDLTRLAPYEPDNYRMLAALYSELKQPFTAISVLDSAEYKLGRIEELTDLKRRLLIDVSLYDKAIAESRNMIVEYPWNPENYRVLASLYARTNKDSLAQATYKQALALDSTDVETLSALTAYYRSKGDWPSFFSTARRMVALDNMPLKEKLTFVNELKNNRTFYNDNFFQIKELISTLLIKYPKDFDVIDLYGETLIGSSGIEQALVFYKSHLKDPGVPVSIYNTVMDIEGYLKRPDSVAKYSALALARFPDDVDLYVRQGGVFSYMDRSDEAMEAYKKALKYARTDSTYSVILGVIGDEYHKRGEGKRSYGYYKKALKRSPDNEMVLNNFSYYLSTDGPNGRDLEQSVAMGKRATELSPGNPTYLDTYAWALFKSGQLAEAKKVMQQAVALDAHDNPELYCHYGDILYELGEYFMASVYWKKALEQGYDADKINERLKKVEGK